MGSKAKRRKEEEYKRALARIIDENTRDRKFEFATVTDVELTEDFKYADVYIDLIGSEEEKQKSLQKFNDEEGFFRTNLAHEVNPRFTPELDFKIDRGLERLNKIEEILEKDKEADEDETS
ncbi:30S ribosome-binding factor RbfA [Candidatus Bipolaricaulota bacterium]|nr:30S ribosome-binding factor RbfA [Candidatus Bipolaricaulota bacterium]